ncbi:MAG TPA: hypothetical protein VGE02_11365 [Gemmatimonadales bacterium]
MPPTISAPSAFGPLTPVAAEFTEAHATVHGAYVSRSLQLACSWSLAGAAATGLLLAFLLAAGQIQDPGMITTMALGLGAIGSLLGTVHGAFLGFLSRPEDAVRPVPWRDRAMFIITSVVTFVVALMLGTWLPLSAGLIRAGLVFGWLGVFVSGMITVFVFAWAWDLGWHALHVAYDRWPEHKLGSMLLLGTFVLLATTLLVMRPALPQQNRFVGTVVYLVTAAAATLWVAAPVLGLGLRRRMRGG